MTLSLRAFADSHTRSPGRDSPMKTRAKSSCDRATLPAGRPMSSKARTAMCAAADMGSDRSHSPSAPACSASVGGTGSGRPTRAVTV